MILTVAAVGITDGYLVIKDTFEVILLQYIYNHDNGFSNEFIFESKIQKSTEADGIQQLIQYLENATIIGHRVDFDLDIMFKKWNESREDKNFSVAEITHV